MHDEDYNETQYPDTREGVIQFLTDEELIDDPDTMSFEQGVPGHWIVRGPEGWDRIVCLAGHGGIEANDWFDEYAEFLPSERAWFDAKLARARGDEQLALLTEELRAKYRMFEDAGEI
jgi:hypothetical protein